MLCLLVIIDYYVTASTHVHSVICMVQEDTGADLDHHEVTEVILGHHTETGLHLLDADLGKFTM